MEEWLEQYILQINSDQRPVIDPIESSLETVRVQIAALQQQQDKLCEYLEKGIYSVEMFAKRNTVLSAEIQKLRSSEAELMQQQCSGAEKKKTSLQITPPLSTFWTIMTSLPSWRRTNFGSWF